MNRFDKGVIALRRIIPSAGISLRLPVGSLAACLSASDDIRVHRLSTPEDLPSSLLVPSMFILKRIYILRIYSWAH